MTGLDAEHCEELHLLTRDLLVAPGTPALKFFWDVQLGWFVCFALVMGVNLWRNDGVAPLNGQN